MTKNSAEITCTTNKSSTSGYQIFPFNPPVNPPFVQQIAISVKVFRDADTTSVRLSQELGKAHFIFSSIRIPHVTLAQL